MNTSISVSAIILTCMFLNRVSAQEIDENALFGDTAISMVDSAKLAAASVRLAGTDSTIASFSGSVTAVAQPSVSRDWFTSRDHHEITPSALMVGDLSLDARLPFGMKSYALTETYCLPDSVISFRVPELFLDANFRHIIYFRAGKQVLQWGRGYFWNPTDLVNVEKKSFVDKYDAREGTFGLKTHIPFKTKWNIYGFLDMNNLASVDSLAGAVRFEGLFGGTEAGCAVWGKRGKDPIFGIDFSTTILKWSLSGEMSLTSGDNYRIINFDKSAFASYHNALQPVFVYSSPDNDAVVRLCIGLMRSFDFLDVDDRLMVIGEFYFNQIGDKGNVFKKYHIRERLAAIEMLPDSLRTYAMAPLQSAFEINSIARYYSAFYVTVGKFIISDCSLQLQGLVNYNHRCATLMAGVTYSTIYNFTLGCMMIGYVGPKDAEYTFTGNGASLRLTAGVSF